ncbi:MAG: diguanylate cyclase [Denitrovibrio sp.]|nr:MAG: diguanylate cyclase [Denitrovibrio sp.]
MIVCFPVEQNNGVESAVFGHFGSAPGFVTYNTETEELDFIDNKNMVHEHGACNPAAALAGRKVDTVVVGGIGRGAIMKLASSGVSVVRSKSGVIADDIKSFINGELEMLSENMQTCSHGTHDCSH